MGHECLGGTGVIVIYGETSSVREGDGDESGPTGDKEGITESFLGVVGAPGDGAVAVGELFVGAEWLCTPDLLLKVLIFPQVFIDAEHFLSMHLQLISPLARVLSFR